MLVVVFFVMVPKMGAFFWCNDIASPFDEGKSGTIENLVIEGSSLYFKANAEIMNLYAETEILPNVEYNNARSLERVQLALGYLKESKSKYLQDRVKPSIPVFWNLLQKLSQLTLFGNYGTIMGQTALGY